MICSGMAIVLEYHYGVDPKLLDADPEPFRKHTGITVICRRRAE